MPDCLKCGRELWRPFDQKQPLTEPWCRDCKDKHRDEYKSVYREWVYQNAPRILRGRGVPERFLNCTLRNFETRSEHQKRAQEAVTAWFQADDCGLFLCGPCGTGKTHLAVGTLLSLAVSRWTGRFVSVLELLTECRDSFRGDDGLNAILEKYSDCDVLLLDDLGAENSTPFAKETLGNLIDRAYRNEQTVIVTSNFDVKALAQKLDYRTADRLLEMCLLIKFAGTSYRQKIAFERVASRHAVAVSPSMEEMPPARVQRTAGPAGGLPPMEDFR
jgi:DNA replication protein DnaC